MSSWDHTSSRGNHICQNIRFYGSCKDMWPCTQIVPFQLSTRPHRKNYYFFVIFSKKCLCWTMTGFSPNYMRLSLLTPFSSFIQASSYPFTIVHSLLRTARWGTPNRLSLFRLWMFPSPSGMSSYLFIVKSELPLVIQAFLGQTSSSGWVPVWHSLSVTSAWAHSRGKFKMEDERRIQHVCLCTFWLPYSHIPYI